MSEHTVCQDKFYRAAEFAGPQRGLVYLIGAGPGDVDMLTIGAVKALRQADVILTDELVNADVMQFVSEQAVVINVGKRHGVKSTPQESIHQKMVDLARQGKCVARLKGGDPFVFGRGGEELEFLLAAGVAVKIVSGITAGVAVPAALGIALSHRELSQSVTFVTGHSKPDGCQPNWEAIARAGGTIVIYMGITNLSYITDQLLAGGMDGATPAAAVENGTLPGQRSTMATLATIAAAVDREGLKSPALVIVGQVVMMAQSYTEIERRRRTVCGSGNGSVRAGQEVL